jgi:F-type H+-transporting ATPase subunit b
MEVFPNWTSIPIVVFLVILTFVLNRTFFRPMSRMLEERDRRIDGARREAEQIRKTSQDRLADFDRKLREGRRQADHQMAQIKNEALNEKSAMLLEKRQESERMLADARVDIRKRTEEARKILETESETFAYEIASQILRRPVGPKRSLQA